MPIGSHQSAAARSDTWLTPPALLDALGPFDLDPCTPPDMPWRTAAHRYTPADDGLACDWFGRVWLNPPYGRAVGDWLARMAAHDQGTALIFARTETEAFFRHVWEGASALLFLEGRLHFHTGDGERASANAGAPSVLAAYGADDVDRLAASGLAGAFVPLSTGRQTVLVLRHEDTVSITWRALLAEVTTRQGGTISLSLAYRLIAKHPKAERNPNWKAKVRQTLQRGGYVRTAPGEYQQQELF
ncbi:DNA N-6-adenine-methyltransferase [Oceanicaulis sp. MMSF_3324]|uniref:DNA N-6-adenine-methyltransferase n=1 Tax=Oceanicaulis sp. MMSF_3324 TaxID=3046702 RepID=UPI00273FC2CA|nr:DNA N-6-adenine-methyltransferase [Oceanicaulis sp. MMSF_3324]